MRFCIILIFYLHKTKEFSKVLNNWLGLQTLALIVFENPQTLMMFDSQGLKGYLKR
jgi:hypothetical protein